MRIEKILIWGSWPTPSNENNVPSRENIDNLRRSLIRLKHATPFSPLESNIFIYVPACAREGIGRYIIQAFLWGGRYGLSGLLTGIQKCSWQRRKINNVYKQTRFYCLLREKMFSHKTISFLLLFNRICNTYGSNLLMNTIFIAGWHKGYFLLSTDRTTHSPAPTPSPPFYNVLNGIVSKFNYAYRPYNIMASTWRIVFNLLS